MYVSFVGTSDTVNKCDACVCVLVRVLKFSILLQIKRDTKGDAMKVVNTNAMNICRHHRHHMGKVADSN